MIDLRDIVVQPNRMRQLRTEVVDEVPASIASEGLLQPIVAAIDYRYDVEEIQQPKMIPNLNLTTEHPVSIDSHSREFHA
jgi:hypothetical protein